MGAHARHRPKPEKVLEMIFKRVPSHAESEEMRMVFAKQIYNSLVREKVIEGELVSI